MRKYILWIGVIALVWIGCARKGNGEATRHAGHTEKAVASATGHEGHGAAPGAKKATKYHCPMHPSYISDRPGDCPICGMKLVPIEEEEEAITVSVPGLADVKISPERQQLIGVRTGVVERRPLEKTIRTVGKVDYDERNLVHVHTRIEGWIKKLFVNYTGQLVKKHQPLFTIYSPEVVATQEEYLLALRAKKSLQDNPFQDVASGSATLLEAARRRLLLWEISEAQIEELERTGKPLTEVAIASHTDGFVIEKKALEGMRVEAGEDLYVIADLSDVWVYADIYEHELPLVKVGQGATVGLSYYPGDVFRGKVVYVYPYMESQTRTVRVRVELPNPGWRLKPGMFANVEVQTERGEGLVVPGGAVLDSGERKIAFVDKGEGRFEPREVRLGGRAGEGFEVLQGLSEGERVITSANFLIDSESQIKAALGAMGGHRHD